jgi:iron complex transport system substrate-binding protein
MVRSFLKRRGGSGPSYQCEKRPVLAHTLSFWPHRLPRHALGLGVLCPLAFALFLSASAVFPREVIDQTGRRVNIPDHPQRIISLAPSITETLYALGLGDLVVGDTDYCDYPPAARVKPHVGAMLNPNLERIVALKPDLVLGTDEANRRETADQLARLGIPLYGLTARTLDGTLTSLEDLGRLLGYEQSTEKVVAHLRERVEAVEKRVQGRHEPKVLFVVWYRPLITAGKQTFIADVIRHAGGISISDDLTGEWPHMSLEEVLKRDPDVILFPRTAAFAPALEEFRKLPGWRELRAVKSGRMYFVSETIMRPCPRLVDALEDLAGILHPEARPQGNRP